MNKTEIQLKQVNSLQELDNQQLETAIDTYQGAFAKIPYLELFTREESISALQFILNKGGDLLVGQNEKGIVSLAGGYINEENDYFIEELAVSPDKQRKGIGRQTLSALIDLGMKRNPNALEIRTTAANSKAIPLYQSEGFKLSNIREVVAKKRQDGKIALDERVYLRKPIKEETMRRTKTIKRAVIAYPSGNTTAVIFDQMLDENRKPFINSQQVMDAWKKLENGKPEIEQCCFVTLPTDKRAIARVQMFGGEFCGNATRSVIQLVTDGKDYQGLIEVSGVERPLNFKVEDGVIGLEMPIPLTSELTKIVPEGVLVQLDGIAQLVVNKDTRFKQTPRELLDELLRRNKYSLTEQSAVGVSYYDRDTETAEFCVWVKKEKTIFDETACGSGTCAIGIASALEAKESKILKVIQPSGESITTQAILKNGKVVASIISGTVSTLYDGKLKI